MKDDLISRQEAIDAIEENIKARLNWVTDSRLERQGLNAAMCAIEDLQSIDAVEVVRCKDCFFGHRFFDVINGVTDSWVECRNPDGLNRDVSEDGFCSAGERKNV